MTGKRSSPEPGPPEEVQKLRTQLEEETARAEEAAQKAEEYLKHWQRAQADFINYKRRTEQEKTELTKFANAMLILKILPALDDLERAADTVQPELAGLNWVQGVLAIQQKFTRLLEALDVKELTAEGDQFDPSRHEAIGQQPGPEGRVVHVAQKGYLLGDKVLRPAMVIVGDGNNTK